MLTQSPEVFDSHAGEDEEEECRTQGDASLKIAGPRENDGGSEDCDSGEELTF